MPASPTPRPTRRTGRPAGRTKSTTAATSRRRKAAAARRVPAAPASGLPGWSDLGLGTGSKGRKESALKKVTAAKARRAQFLDVAPSLRFVVWTLVLCLAATLYVGHVFATRDGLAELQRVRRENLRLHLTHERLQGAYDRMTGPDQILERAASLGLEEGIAYGPVIHTEE